MKLSSSPKTQSDKNNPYKNICLWIALSLLSVFGSACGKKASTPWGMTIETTPAWANVSISPEWLEKLQDTTQIQYVPKSGGDTARITIITKNRQGSGSWWQQSLWWQNSLWWQQNSPWQKNDPGWLVPYEERVKDSIDNDFESLMRRIADCPPGEYPTMSISDVLWVWSIKWKKLTTKDSLGRPIIVKVFYQWWWRSEITYTDNEWVTHHTYSPRVGFDPTTCRSLIGVIETVNGAMDGK